MLLFISAFESLTGLPDFAGYLFIFILGTLFGSFLNVVIHRVPNEESIIFPNSACPHCSHKIKPYDNIPILSWLILRGKCRNCQEPISARYPAVELLTALVYVLVFWQLGLSWYLPVVLLFTTAMIALIFIDAEHMILPDAITYPLLAFAVIIRLIYPIVLTENFFSDTKYAPLTYLQTSPAWLVSILGAILGGLAGGGLLWLVGELWLRLRGVEAMGFGDVKMMFAVGALLGWRLTLLSIFLGAFSGAVVGIFLILKHKDKNFQTQIPFGIFLGIGSVLALLFGDQLIAWYIRSFVP